MNPSQERGSRPTPATDWDRLPLLLTVWPEVASILRVPRTRAYELAATGQIPGVVRLGARQYRVNRDALRRWLEGGEAA